MTARHNAQMVAETLTCERSGLVLTQLTRGDEDELRRIVATAEVSRWWDVQPDDFPYDPKKPLPKLGVGPDPAHVLAGDGSVWRLSPQATEKGIQPGKTRQGEGV